MIDAGFYFNVPTPPLLDPQRGVEIIFICDASSDASLSFYPQLRLAANYAHDHGLRFPSVEHPTFHNDNLLVFKSEDPRTPTVVYFPNRIPDPTLKLEYTPKEFEALCSYMEQACFNNKETIINVIKERVTPAPSAPPIEIDTTFYQLPPLYPAPGFAYMQTPLISHYQPQEDDYTDCCCFPWHRNHHRNGQSLKSSK